MALRDMLAKSDPLESLVSHLAATLDGALELRRRVGAIALADQATSGLFWLAACLAALCHDAGKIPDGFQAMLRGRTRSWGERHEVVSLGFLPALIEDEILLTWVATGVATHHRSLEGGRGPLTPAYGTASADEWRARLCPIPGDVVAELTAWLSETARRAGLLTVMSSPLAGAQPADNPSSSLIPTIVDRSAGGAEIVNGREQSPGHRVAVEAPGIVESARRVFDLLLDRWDLPVTADEGLTAILLQGAVTLSDHVSSARGTLNTRQPLDAGFRLLLEDTFRARGHSLRPHQEAAAEVDGHLLLRAPTGSGKTEAALMWAAAQVMAIGAATGGVPRVFFTLPYLASINAMAVRLGGLLGDEAQVGVMHSRAGSFHLDSAICALDDDDHGTAARKAVSRAAATRLFRETMRVGTPYQILRGVLAGPSHAGMLIDAANSVFVLDELHAYDPRRLGYILATMRLWERIGGRVAVLSATLPDALAQLIRDTLDADAHLVEASTKGLRRRHRLALRERPLTHPDSVEEIRGRLTAGESVLVVANNVADVQHMFAELGRDVEDAFLLHSRFRRMDRAELETAISDRFGAGRPRQGGLLVATQVVEVSIDVDFDCLFTSAAPLEALLQRFGRVNRVAVRPPADVVVHEAVMAPRREGGEGYADGVYVAPPVEAAWTILRRHDGAEVDEAEARVWLDEVYGTAWGREWRTEVARHQAEFDEAFLRFAHPFVSREDLAERFDELFDGTEAVLEQDRDAYEASLNEVTGSKAAGRLLAERYLIPMPHWAAPLTSWEKRLGVRIVHADYDERLGLGKIHGPAAQTYQAGEVL